MMNNLIIAGALFDFMGWLTSRPKRIMLSSVDDASPAVDAIKDFAKMRGLSLDDAQVQTWQEALAQPQQEPLEYWNAVEGWVKINEVREHFDSVGCGTIYKTAGEDRVPVYTTPPQRTWVGLTPSEIETVLRQWDYEAGKGGGFKKLVAITEAKLKEKNT